MSCVGGILLSLGMSRSMFVLFCITVQALGLQVRSMGLCLDVLLRGFGNV